MPTIHDLVPQIVALMQAENIELREPVSAKQFLQFERKWGVELPVDMREFYEHMDGTSKDHSCFPMVAHPALVPSLWASGRD